MSRVLRRRPDCLVVVEDGGEVVAKVFTGTDSQHELRLAEREHEHLRAFATALRDVPGAACPEPIELVPGPPPRVRMARAPGVPLLDELRERALGADTSARLAEAMAAALAVYVATFAEPWWDFQFDNVLYDQTAGTVWFVDFGVPPGSAPSDAGSSPAALALGNLAGSTIFQSTRPKWLLRRRQHRQAAALAGDVLACAIAAPGAPAELASQVADAARAAYERSAREGRWYRRAWFSVAGPLFGRGIRVADRRISPRSWA